ncbi:TMEM165/GDT1 family protein [Ramlibacter tataouinensis]|uniref:TMEM165/GDT1 family protein n=1 Tax=Ramlibacter tataouinensis TaxID=94132 RepID=UPI0022F3ADDB|nr:TMEM165/GDT1 family protein [Ramlibacter tataouinensis]WBY01327.1 TMEM165/GDT1 family protein [Ramlibacter tataouinensis]
MEALFASFGLVAVAEMGDKTQLLSFLLAARFKGRHWALIWGILAATLANHFLAAAAGDWIAAHVDPQVMRWVLGAAFLGFAAWALIPDKLEDDAESSQRRALGPFLTTLVAFFIAEMGDKTQFATVALGANYASLSMVVVGTTLGMMAANVPAVLLGERLARYVPLSRMRFVAAALFAVFGVVVLMGIDFGLVAGTGR